MKRIVTAAIFVLTVSAPAFADTVPEGVTLRAYPPVGNGDPNAISCWAWRTTPPIQGLQCARNAEWRLALRSSLRGVGSATDWASTLDPWRVVGMPSGAGPSAPAAPFNPFETRP